MIEGLEVNLSIIYSGCSVCTFDRAVCIQQHIQQITIMALITMCITPCSNPTLCSNIAELAEWVYVAFV